MNILCSSKSHNPASGHFKITSYILLEVLLSVGTFGEDPMSSVVTSEVMSDQPL